MAFFDTLKQNLMTASQVTMDKAKNTAEILKLKDQIRQDKREIRSATYKIGEIYRELHFENYEEAAFIRSLSFLTDSEKDALIADYSRLMEIDSRLCELYNSIWGNTGCESGICPL